MSQQTTPLRAEIITSGTEILLGDIVDTNAAWIAQQLRDIGVNLYYKTTVGDNEPRLRGVLELGLSRSDVLIVTGGLGPTVDDITRDAIANATGRPLRLDDEALAQLRARFARFGSTMTANNERQALIPDGATVIQNPVGTAPGFFAIGSREGLGGTIIALPGVPREMKRLMADTVLPWLQEENARRGGSGVIRRRLLRTIGIGESTIDSRIGELMRGANPTVGTAAHIGQADVRIAARALTAEEADALIDEMEAQIREHIGDHIYSTTDDEPIEAVVARQLRKCGATVALVESNTRGGVAARLRTASDQAGEDALVAAVEQVDQPTVDEASAVEAARSLLARTEAAYAVALLGTSGADEGMYGQTSGETWIAFARRTGGDVAVDSTRYPFGGQDDFTLRRLGNRAFELLWREMEA